MADLIMELLSVFAILLGFWLISTRYRTAMNFHDAIIRAKTIDELSKKKAVD